MMKNKFNIELEIEHDGSSSTQEIAEAIQMQLEQNNGQSTDDFGIIKSTVVNVMVDDKK